LEQLLIGLLGRLGDHAELGRVGQDNLLGERFDQGDEPLVAGGGLDDGLEVAQPGEEGADGVDFATGEGAAGGDLAVLVHDADDDSLLVEVDAAVLHGKLLFVETRGD
jgi:hypothetical protein